MSKWCTSAAQGSLNVVKLIFHRTWLLADDELSPTRRRCVPYNLLGVLRWQWHSRLLTQRRFSLRGCSPLGAVECSGAAGLERERGLGAPDHPLSAPPTARCTKGLDHGSRPEASPPLLTITRLVHCRRSNATSMAVPRNGPGSFRVTDHHLRVSCRIAELDLTAGPDAHTLGREAQKPRRLHYERARGAPQPGQADGRACGAGRGTDGSGSYRGPARSAIAPPRAARGVPPQAPAMPQRRIRSRYRE